MHLYQNCLLSSSTVIGPMGVRVPPSAIFFSSTAELYPAMFWDICLLISVLTGQEKDERTKCGCVKKTFGDKIHLHRPFLKLFVVQ
jgi:hypothetical protein